MPNGLSHFGRIPCHQQANGQTANAGRQPLARISSYEKDEELGHRNNSKHAILEQRRVKAL